MEEEDWLPGKKKIDDSGTRKKKIDDSGRRQSTTMEEEDWWQWLKTINDSGRRRLMTVAEGDRCQWQKTIIDSGRRRLMTVSLQTMLAPTNNLPHQFQSDGQEEAVTLGGSVIPALQYSSLLDIIMVYQQY